MKRLWMGCGLLLALLVLGLWSAGFVGNSHTPTIRLLRQASEDCLDGRLESATHTVEQAYRQWQANRSLTAALSHHKNVDEAERLFSQALVYSRLRQPRELAACCAALQYLLESLAQEHSPLWWNLM